MRRTTIVATLGPVSSDPDTIKALVRAGMSVARINFSHGTYPEHRERIANIRAVSKQTGFPIACLQDLCGPKIRTGPMSEPDGVLLETGNRFVLTSDKLEGTADRVSTTYDRLHLDIQPGERVLLDDGAIELEVLKVQGHDLITRVVNGGLLKPAKGINFPGSELSVPALTEKDRKDVLFGLSLDVDMMALSFVRRAEDVLELKEYLATNGRADMPVIAKIEKPEALENLDSILDVVEGVMVARGDLGVEMPAEEVPMHQKRIIYEARRRGRLVITATQMLDSMILNPRPTRAESSDVANAIIDGTDAVMLSGETAVGKYPVETVSTMARIIEYTESMRHRIPWEWPSDSSLLERSSVSRAVAKAACSVAEELDARYIITFSTSGETARLVSHYRPGRPVLALAPSERVCRQLALPWGITPILSKHYESIEQLMFEGLDVVKEKGLVKPGDTAVVIFGTSLMPGATDVMKVHRF